MRFAVTCVSPGRISSISRKAEVSGGSSGGRLTHARAVMTRLPKRTLRSIGASKVEIRAVVLSSPCSTATGAAAAGTVMAAARAAARSADTRISALPVGIDEPVEQLADDPAELRLVGAHEHGVLERILRQLADLLEILGQHLDLLAARERL